MANIKSQIKRNRQNIAAHERNKVVRSSLKTDLKKVESAIASGEKEAAEAAYDVASRSLDKAATKGVIHTNKAANKKSRLAKRIKAL